MTDKESEGTSWDQAERSLECTECRKAIAVRYTEVMGNVLTHTVMCADCPQLERRLHGIRPITASTESTVAAGLCCGGCDTTLEDLRRIHTVGCSNCYDVFQEEIVLELIHSKHLNPRIATIKKTAPIHIGRQPGEMLEINPSVRLSALNEALNETLRREDYEQAAWLRDQIKDITETQNDKKT